jgi:predicted P-loop ATPase
MTIKLEDDEDLREQAMIKKLGHGGGVYNAALLGVPEEIPVADDSVQRRATGEEISGAQWKAEQRELRMQLRKNHAGCMKKTKDGLNVVLTRSTLHFLLTLHPYWRGAIRFNELLSIVECAGRRADNTLTTQTIEWLEAQWGYRDVKKGDILDAIDYVARSQVYHPVREYLERLPAWDGTPRIDDLVDVLKAEPAGDRDLYSAYLRTFFVGAVMRALEPGSKFDTMLVLLGAQGARKSTFWRVLAGEPPFYNELPSTKWDDIYSVHGAWIHEYAELESVTTRADVGRIKGHLSTLVDAGALKYERQVTYLKRACVFVGTTNEADSLLRDPTGNRRFHIIRVGSIDIDYVREHRDQLWAEALAMRNAGELPWLSDPSLVAAQASATAQYVLEDPWREPIETYVVRNMFAPIRVPDILKALDVEVAKQTKADEMRVATILRELGFQREQKRVGGEKQRYWVRKAD